MENMLVVRNWTIFMMTFVVTGWNPVRNKRLQSIMIIAVAGMKIILANKKYRGNSPKVVREIIDVPS